MKRTWYKIILGLIKAIFIRLLTDIVSACASLSNQKCMAQPTLINLHPSEYSQEFHYYPFTVKLDKYVRICNTHNDVSHKLCVPNKTEDLKIFAFKIIRPITFSAVKKVSFPQ